MASGSKGPKKQPGVAVPKPKKKPGKYRRVIEAVFAARYKSKAKEVAFSRDDIAETSHKLGVKMKNLGDVVYAFRYRQQLPDSIQQKAPAGLVWIIRGTGAAEYRFCAVPPEYAYISPRSGLAETKVPDATPGVIAKYRLDDEQALLARVRYNRLIDIFMGVASYSLQSHLRTQVDDIGQVETDEVYVGVDKRGAHFVFPVQAKGGADQHSIVQVEQDIAMCKRKFPGTICRAIAAQFMEDEKIALFSFSASENGEAKYLDEKHYILVSPDRITAQDLEEYRLLPAPTS